MWGKCDHMGVCLGGVTISEFIQVMYTTPLDIFLAQFLNLIFLTTPFWARGALGHLQWYCWVCLCRLSVQTIAVSGTVSRNL